LAKAEPIATNPLATARQLWALNRAGALRLYIPGTAYADGPLSAQQADRAIKALAAPAPNEPAAPADPEHLTVMRGLYQRTDDPARREHEA
jgi:hypothetical protein